MIEQESNNLKESRKKGVLNEDLDSKLDLVLEGFSALDKKIDGLDVKMDEKFGIVDFKFGMVFEDLHELKQFQSESNLKFEVIFEELHEMRGDIKELKPIAA